MGWLQVLNTPRTKSSTIALGSGSKGYIFVGCPLCLGRHALPPLRQTLGRRGLRLNQVCFDDIGRLSARRNTVLLGRQAYYWGNIACRPALPAMTDSEGRWRVATNPPGRSGGIAWRKFAGACARRPQENTPETGPCLKRFYDGVGRRRYTRRRPAWVAITCCSNVVSNVPDGSRGPAFAKATTCSCTRVEP